MLFRRQSLTCFYVNTSHNLTCLPKLAVCLYQLPHARPCFAFAICLTVSEQSCLFFVIFHVSGAEWGEKYPSFDANIKLHLRNRYKNAFFYSLPFLPITLTRAIVEEPQEKRLRAELENNKIRRKTCFSLSLQDVLSSVPMITECVT